MTEYFETSKNVNTREEEDYHITATFDGDESITVRVEFTGFDDHDERAEIGEFILRSVAALFGK